MITFKNLSNSEILGFRLDHERQRVHRLRLFGVAGDERDTGRQARAKRIGIGHVNHAGNQEKSKCSQPKHNYSTQPRRRHGSICVVEARAREHTKY